MSRINSDTTGRNPFMDNFDQEIPPMPKSARPALDSPLFGLTFDKSAPSATFSFPPSKTPKRANPALGSAFSSPALDCYPTPATSHKKKAKFTHHSPNNSLDLKGPPLPPITLDRPFESPLEPTFGGSIGLGLGGAFSSSPKKPSRAGGSLGASNSFYLAGEDDVMSNGSISSLDSATSSASSAFFPTTRRGRLTTSSSCGSFASDSDTLTVQPQDDLKHGSPSPMSSTFDLNELSLEALESEEMITESKSPQMSGGPQDYWQAGHAVQQLRESLGGYGWTRE